MPTPRVGRLTGGVQVRVEGHKVEGRKQAEHHKQSASLTRSRTLEHIRASGRISRVELAQMSGLTAASISGIVAQTIADGLVVESGLSTSTRGKPRTLLELNPSARHAVGVTLDHDRLTYVVTDLSGHLLGRLVVDGTGDQEPDLVVRRVGQELTTLLANTGVDRTNVLGIGLASPGPLDSRAGILLSPKPSPAWHGYPLVEKLEEHSGLSVLLDNDATCAAVGEYWVSNGHPAAVSATVYMAEGIGCGILLHGAAFHGASSNTGELGHISLDVNGPECQCGLRGCLETYARPAVIVEQAFRDHDLVADLELNADGHTQRTFARIGRAASCGHPASLALISESASYLAAAVVTLSNLLDLEEVHLSGPGFATAGAIYGRAVQKRLQESSFMRDIHPVEVHVSQTGTDAAALGAAAVVLQRAITPHAVVR